MAFSFDTAISIITNAANELTRAARDLGDELPDDPITETINNALAAMNDAITELTAKREFVAAGGLVSDFPTKLDVKRQPGGMAEPGADMVEMPDADAMREAEAARVEAQNAELRAAVAANPPVVAVATKPAASTSPAKPDAGKKDADK